MENKRDLKSLHFLLHQMLLLLSLPQYPAIGETFSPPGTVVLSGDFWPNFSTMFKQF